MSKMAPSESAQGAERTLTNKDVQSRAHEALEILMAVEDDSFAPTNAVRCLGGYDAMTEGDRLAINEALERLCVGEPALGASQESDG